MGAYQIYNGQIADMRRQGNTLREIGETIGVSKERIRQILAQHFGGVEMLLLNEVKAAEAIGCPIGRLRGLREEGVISPKHTGHFCLYDRYEMEKAMLALQRSCLHCGEPLPLFLNGRRKYCLECSEERKRYTYPFMSEEAKKKARQASERWGKEHPERYREIARRAMKKYLMKKRQEQIRAAAENNLKEV